MRNKKQLLAVMSAAFLLGLGMDVQADDRVQLPDFGTLAEDYILADEFESREFDNVYYYEIQGDAAVELLNQYISVLIMDYDFEVIDNRIYEASEDYSTSTEYVWFEYSGSESVDGFGLTIFRDDYHIDSMDMALEYNYSDNSVHSVWFYISKDMYMDTDDGQTTIVSETPSGNSGGNSNTECTYCGGRGTCDKCGGLGEDLCTCLGGSCPTCSGMGHKMVYTRDGYEYRDCRTCGGSGMHERCDGTGFLTCTLCHGTGDCTYCNGTGER